MVPLGTVDARRSYEPFFAMRKAFATSGSSTRSTSPAGGYDSSSSGAHHAFAVSASSTSVTSRRSVLELRDADVVGGRSGMTNAHPGNRLYNSLVKARSRQYKGTSRREEKSRITNEVIFQIESSGGRFLAEENGEYFEVCTTTVPLRITMITNGSR